MSQFAHLQFKSTLIYNPKIMAKKGNRNIFLFQCSVCKNKNHMGTRNTVNIKEKLTLKKFCKHCRKTTEHLEIKIGK